MSPAKKEYMLKWLPAVFFNRCSIVSSENPLPFCSDDQFEVEALAGPEKKKNSKKLLQKHCVDARFIRLESHDQDVRISFWYVTALLPDVMALKELNLDLWCIWKVNSITSERVSDVDK